MDLPVLPWLSLHRTLLPAPWAARVLPGYLEAATASQVAS